MKWCKRTNGGRRKPRREERGWTVTIDRKFRIPLPSLPYKAGTRLFWKVNRKRNAVVATVSPKGTLRDGRYHSSRIRVMVLRHRILKSITNSRRLASR